MDIHMCKRATLWDHKGETVYTCLLQICFVDIHMSNHICRERDVDLCTSSMHVYIYTYKYIYIHPEDRFIR